MTLNKIPNKTERIQEPIKKISDDDRDEISVSKFEEISNFADLKMDESKQFEADNSTIDTYNDNKFRESEFKNETFSEIGKIESIQNKKIDYKGL